MISLHFTTRLPGFTLEADCDLPGDGFTAVLGPSSCGKSTLFGRRLGGRRTAVDQERLIEVLGIAHLLSRRPDTLSGGESQRVALGRGILAAETLLIMDEPLASLDSERKAELLGYFERIPEITGIPVLYITPPTKPRGSRRPSSR